MNKKEILLEAAHKKNYKDLKDFCGALYRNLNIKSKFDTYYSNFIKKLDDDNKSFTQKEIIAIENILNMRFSDLIVKNYDKVAKYVPYSIDFIAYLNDYDRTKAFTEEKNEYDDFMVTLNNEFTKNFLQCIIKYQSYNCLKCLIDCNGLYFSNNYFILDDPQTYYSVSKEDIIEIEKMICAERDSQSFRSVFHTENDYRFNFGIGDKNIIYSNEFIDNILLSRKILDSLLKTEDIITDYDKSINNNQIIYRKTINIFVPALLTRILEREEFDQELALHIINLSIDLNKKIAKSFMDTDNNFIINEDGLIKINGYYGVARCVRYSKDLRPDAGDLIRRKVLELNDSMDSLLHKNSIDLYGNSVNYHDKIKEYYPSSHNKIQYEMMRYMNSNGCTFVPKLYEAEDKDDKDQIQYLPKYITYRNDSINLDILTRIGASLYDFHKLSNEKLGGNNVYLNNNINKFNFSISNDEVVITDWSKCSIGEANTEIVKTIWNLSGIDNLTFYSNQYDSIIERIEAFLDGYKLEERIYLGDLLHDYVNVLIKELSKNKEKSKAMELNLKYSKDFIEIYKDELNEF